MIAAVALGIHPLKLIGERRCLGDARLNRRRAKILRAAVSDRLNAFHKYGIDVLANWRRSRPALHAAFGGALRGGSDFAVLECHCILLCARSRTSQLLYGHPFGDGPRRSLPGILLIRLPT